MSKFLTINGFLTLLLLILRFVLSSKVIDVLFIISSITLVAFTCIILPILDYKKSKDKKLFNLISPILFILIIVMFLIYLLTEMAIFLLIFCLIVLMNILLEIFKTKKISLNNILLIATIIIVIMMTSLYLPWIYMSSVINNI